ncbi:uncharacterized protein LOC103700810 isoform X1 [Phoenix dactylifera]|uniref:Uncharacterized protein LOC103700810 isoform X1 n=1 Tax=Phoenix dactylifera TaxID=42345 RepID=A0A8B8J0T0_PHODC|nr:uncharacterized protein LOC103700810 isoform X1 [Phoenix dactylifera]XP_026657908.2 uncharacterized protein LOC103700810 isoform X1 [Phoenix dactylifera]XP_026657912.2 uncharacterized protein LOC103700810 isoform X1 [Phoenix dactylifera]
MVLRARELHRLQYLLPEAFGSLSRGGGYGMAGGGRRLLSAGNTSGEEFAGKSAYEVLEVSETSSFAEIKDSFRKLAKETHPDVSPSPDDPAASQRFLQILAAYEILSDSKRRAHYDSYLYSQRTIPHKDHGLGSAVYAYNSPVILTKQNNVVEWLRWYRLTIDDILMQKKVVTRSGYFGKLESELYSAIRTAYYGPIIESMDLLPDCFEAEERSVYETSEVLHLVSGRDLFGIVNIVDKIPQLSHISHEKLNPFDSVASGLCQYVTHTAMEKCCDSFGSINIHEEDVKQDSNFQSDVYKDLELHIYGRAVAVATRSPKCKCIGTQTIDSEDHIHVFLTLHDAQDAVSSGSKILLGTITGLGTSAEEASCSVYDGSGTKTHVIMKHRTLLVKHVRWFRVGGEVSSCECQCSRAGLPPSKYWLFEPRCSMHDIGGWYIETFGQDKKRRTVPSQRQWDGMTEHPEKRLHPAMYLLALAYRTLDLEDAKRRKRSFRGFVEAKFYSVLHWCQKLL